MAPDELPKWAQTVIMIAIMTVILAICFAVVTAIIWWCAKLLGGIE